MSRLVIKGKARNMPYSGSLLALIPAIAAIVSLASLLLLLQTGRVITSSYEVRQLEQEHAHLQARNQQLEAEISALQSLDRIELVAKQMGMVPAKQQFYVTLPTPEMVSAAAQPAQPLWAEANLSNNWWVDFLTWIGFHKHAINP